MMNIILEDILFTEYCSGLTINSFINICEKKYKFSVEHHDVMKYLSKSSLFKYEMKSKNIISIKLLEFEDVKSENNIPRYIIAARYANDGYKFRLKNSDLPYPNISIETIDKEINRRLNDYLKSSSSMIIAYDKIGEFHRDKLSLTTRNEFKKYEMINKYLRIEDEIWKLLMQKMSIEDLKSLDISELDIDDDNLTKIIMIIANKVKKTSFKIQK
jgi:hypothetical protein